MATKKKTAATINEQEDNGPDGAASSEPDQPVVRDSSQRFPQPWRRET